MDRGSSGRSSGRSNSLGSDRSSSLISGRSNSLGSNNKSIAKTQNNNNNNSNNNSNNNNNNINTDNFIEFINHLLTFNKQLELLKSKSNININTEQPFRFNISVNVINKLCDLAYNIFTKEPNIIYCNAPINVFGDIHGQFSDMIHFLEMTGLPPNNKFLFMGDYVDRGKNSIEVCVLLFALKILYPGCIQVLRGNHECPNVNKLYGFYDECIDRFGGDSNSGDGITVFNNINKVLCALPLCAIINEKIFCVHGGLSPSINTIDEINKIDRFINIPDTGALCDLLWSDPSINNSNKWGENSRGVSYTYNAEVIDIFLQTNNLQLLCRAHQLVSEGYKFVNFDKLVTVFSAPNYCGNCGNDGAVMKITKNLECSFIIIKPTN